MVKYYIKATIKTPKGAPRIHYPGGDLWYQKCAMINVRAYDDINHYCLASLEDEELFEELMKTGEIEEVTESEFIADLTRLRPPPSDISVVIEATAKGKDSAIVTHIRTFLEDKKTKKGITYRIDER